MPSAMAAATCVLASVSSAVAGASPPASTPLGVEGAAAVAVSVNRLQPLLPVVPPALVSPLPVVPSALALPEPLPPAVAVLLPEALPPEDAPPAPEPVDVPAPEDVPADALLVDVLLLEVPPLAVPPVADEAVDEAPLPEEVPDAAGDEEAVPALLPVAPVPVVEAVVLPA